MSKEFILKACKSFQSYVKKMAAILSKFTVLCLFSYFLVYFLKSKLILFYNRVIYYYTRIFLILPRYPVNKKKRFSKLLNLAVTNSTS